MRPIVLVGLLTMAALPAAAQSGGSGGGDALAGREVAQRWCATCHVVAPGQTTATSDSIPTFMSIAARPNVTQDGLRAFLADPHGRMPPLVLSRADIDNLSAYILSLRAK